MLGNYVKSCVPILDGNVSSWGATWGMGSGDPPEESGGGGGGGGGVGRRRRRREPVGVEQARHVDRICDGMLCPI